MNLSDRLKASNDVMIRRIGDETVLLDLASGTYCGLDPVGARVWRLIEDGERTLAEVCNAILDEYDVEQERLERDILALAAQLAAHRLVAIAR